MIFYQSLFQDISSPPDRHIQSVKPPTNKQSYYKVPKRFHCCHNRAASGWLAGGKGKQHTKNEKSSQHSQGDEPQRCLFDNFDYFMYNFLKTFQNFIEIYVCHFARFQHPVDSLKKKKKRKRNETKQLKSQAFATYVPLVETISDLKCRPLRAINIMTFLMAILKYATPNQKLLCDILK